MKSVQKTKQIKVIFRMGPINAVIPLKQLLIMLEDKNDSVRVKYNFESFLVQKRQNFLTT